MRDDLASLGECEHRRILPSNAAATDGDEQIASIDIECLRDREGIARDGLDAHDIGAGRAQTSRDQFCRDIATGNIDDAYARHAEEITGPPRLDDRAFVGDLATLSAN